MPFDKFFRPKNVAIIGASHSEGKIGYIILKSFMDGFKGDIYPINPNTEPILGKRVYPNVLDIPDKVDLAVISIPAKGVPEALADCVEKGVEVVIIISGGFSEIGNKHLEEECRKIISGTKTRVIGPNCLGIYDSSSSVDTIFLPKERCGRPGKGDISFVSQSGAVGSTMLDWLAEQGTGIGKFISYGNAMDITETDLIEYLGEDRDTRVIAVYLEGIKDSGKRFIEVCRRVSRKKPIIVLKAGKSEKGKKAVSSHTGSLAGSGNIYSGAFKQAGLIEAETWEELFDFARTFSSQPLPRGKRLLIVTDGGGFGVLATDEAERAGLELPEPSKELKKRLKDILPDYTVKNNPIDLTGDADAERYRLTLEETVKSKEFDAFLIITLFQVPTLGEDVVDCITAMKKHNRPIVVCSTGGEFSERMNKRLMANGVAVLPSPERAVKALSALHRYWKYLTS
ncbi:hypothetical protein A3K63_01225 [Candidatus Micrarchaeota archaeon RBG_16_49_10]|nr:MAG: hypothetical protein A3K63_01225 [Candidatus Micrarchaeota archaeon RBG_16_49_10]